MAIVPDSAVAARIAEAANELGKRCRRLNAVPRGNYHVTLAFIGETERTDLAAEAVRAVEQAPFPITFAGVGKFTRTRGDIYWYGVRASEALRELCDKVNGELTSRGFAIEARAFRPHVTLARDAVCDSDIAIKAPEIKYNVTAISLMRSDRIDGRTVYAPVVTKELK